MTILQDVNIDKKRKEATSDGYGIGIFIGAFSPFVVLVISAYAIYRYNKTDIKTINMDILSFFGGNGLFLILGLALIIVYIKNRNKK